MFDLMTILTLLAPAIIAPLACRFILRAIGRAEADRRPAPAPPTQIVLDSSAAPLAAEHTRARNVA